MHVIILDIPPCDYKHVISKLLTKHVSWIFVVWFSFAMHTKSSGGFKETEAECVVDLICDAIENRNDQAHLDRIKNEVKELCNNFPVYS